MDGFNIISYKEDKYIEFYLSSFKNTIFKLELYCCYLGASKLIFNKINLKDNFVNSLQQQSGKYYDYLSEFFEMINKLNK